MTNNDARVISPGDIISANEAAAILGITKPSVTRRVKAGTLPVLAQLEGPNGTLVFDRNDVLEAAHSGR